MKDNTKINTILFGVCLFIYAFLPTSLNGVIFENIIEVPRWFLTILIIISFCAINRVNKTRFVASFIIILYLMVVTLISLQMYGGKFSLARFVPAVCLLLLFSIDFTVQVDRKSANIFIIILLTAAVLWGIGLILKVSPIGEFTIRYYSQSYQSAVPRSVAFGKPVFTFGIHTRAALFYFGVFVVLYDRYIKTQQVLALYGCITCAILCFFLTSNSALVYTACMAAMLLWRLKTKPFVLVLSILFISVLVASFLPDLMNRYQISMNSVGNGMTGRYSESAHLYDDNFEIIKHSLGVGFSIPDRIHPEFADSGWIMFLTMGGIVFAVAIYLMLFFSIKSNVAGIGGWFLFFLIMSFEFVESGMWFNRFVYLYIISIQLLRDNIVNSYDENRKRIFRWKIVFRHSRTQRT